MRLLKNILLVMISPKVGWEDVERCGFPTSRILRGAFYPLLVILAISSFVPMVYDSVGNTVTSSLMKAIIAVAMYLFSYYFASYLLSGFYPELARSRITLARLNNFIIYCLIFEILITIIINLLPGTFAPLYFLFIYVGYMAMRGAPFLGLKESKLNKFVTIATFMLIGFPLIIKWLLSIIIIK